MLSFLLFFSGCNFSKVSKTGKAIEGQLTISDVILSAKQSGMIVVLNGDDSSAVVMALSPLIDSLKDQGIVIETALSTDTLTPNGKVIIYIGTQSVYSQQYIPQWTYGTSGVILARDSGMIIMSAPTEAVLLSEINWLSTQLIQAGGGTGGAGSLPDSINHAQITYSPEGTISSCTTTAQWSILNKACAKITCLEQKQAGTTYYVLESACIAAIPPEILKCSDGTVYGTCSQQAKPKKCENGQIINKCTECGCNAGDTCGTEGTCIIPTRTCTAEYTRDAEALGFNIGSLQMKNDITKESCLQLFSTQRSVVDTNICSSDWIISPQVNITWGTEILSTYDLPCNNTCSDTDNGENYYSKGIITYKVLDGVSYKNSFVAEDLCLGTNSAELDEFFCSGQFKNRTKYICPNGCKDGACIVNNNNAYDSDNYTSLKIIPSSENTLRMDFTARTRINYSMDMFRIEQFKPENFDGTGYRINLSSGDYQIHVTNNERIYPNEYFIIGFGEQQHILRLLSIQNSSTTHEIRVRDAGIDGTITTLSFSAADGKGTMKYDDYSYSFTAEPSIADSSLAYITIPAGLTDEIYLNTHAKLSLSHDNVNLIGSSTQVIKLTEKTIYTRPISPEFGTIFINLTYVNGRTGNDVYLNQPIYVSEAGSTIPNFKLIGTQGYDFEAKTPFGTAMSYNADTSSTTKVEMYLPNKDKDPIIKCSDSDQTPDLGLVSVSPSDITPQTRPDLFQKSVGKGEYAASSDNFIFGQEPTPLVPKTATDLFSTYYDYCANSEQLNEAYCITTGPSIGKLGAVGITCPSGCQDGACVQLSYDRCSAINLITPRAAVPNDQYSCFGRTITFLPATLRFNQDSFIIKNVSYKNSAITIKGTSQSSGGPMLLSFDCNKDGIFEDALNVNINEFIPFSKMHSFVKESCSGNADILIAANTQDTISISNIVISSTTPTTCTDSDHGRDQFASGSVSIIIPDNNGNVGGISTTPDGCAQLLDSGLYHLGPDCAGDKCYVYEQMCKATADNKLIQASEYIKCSNSCKSGACLPSITINSAEYLLPRFGPESDIFSVNITNKQTSPLDLSKFNVIYTGNGISYNLNDKNDLQMTYNAYKFDGPQMLQPGETRVLSAKGGATAPLFGETAHCGTIIRAGLISNQVLQYELGPKDIIGLQDIKLNCVEPTETTCRDSDSGKDYSSGGAVLIWPNNTYDTCNENQKTLTEYFCGKDAQDKPVILSETITCPDGCMYGRCIEKIGSALYEQDFTGSQLFKYSDSAKGFMRLGMPEVNVQVLTALYFPADGSCTQSILSSNATPPKCGILASVFIFPSERELISYLQTRISYGAGKAEITTTQTTAIIYHENNMKTVFWKNANSIVLIQNFVDSKTAPGKYNISDFLPLIQKYSELYPPENLGDMIIPIKLNKGWNLINIPLNPVNPSPSVVFKNLKNATVFSYNPKPATQSGVVSSNWEVWRSDLDVPSNLRVVEGAKGYWIKLEEPQTLYLMGGYGIKTSGQPIMPPTLKVGQGWNLIGPYGIIPPQTPPTIPNTPIPPTISTLKDMIKGNDDKFVSGWGYDAYRGSLIKINKESPVIPGQGYWVYMNADAEIIY